MPVNSLEGLSDVLRKGVSDFGIDVIIIEPGGTQSEMTGLGTEYLKKVSGKYCIWPFIKSSD